MLFFRRSRRHSWMWYAFWALMFCIVLYRVARMFLKAAEKSGAPRRPVYKNVMKNKSRGKEPFSV